MPEQYKASVRVLRSYDYCHFECQLSSDDPQTPDQVNEMRKKAALLCDEAVRQYRIAKQKESKRDSNQWECDRLLERIKTLKAKPETELTAEEMAILRVDGDKDFWAKYHEDDYTYCDDSERDYHFSMLRRFKEHKAKA